jgi:hypothetical protein
MPIVPLGLGAYKRSSGFVPEVQLRNFYLEQDVTGISPDKTLRVQRPGLTAYRTLPGAIRGLNFREATGETFAVAGGTLYNSDTASGGIAGIDQTPMVSTPFGLFIAGGGTLYTYDIALSSIALPDDAPDGGTVQDIDQLDAYVLVLLPSGRFYWIVPGATTIDPLNFATAESLPDGAMAIRRLGDEFIILGTQGAEIWQATGDPDAPFQRATGRGYEKGCLYRDTVVRFDNTLVWVTDQYEVCRASAVPEVISDPALSDRIRRATGDCSAMTFAIDGHDLWLLRIPGQGTFAYDALTKAWSEFATYQESVWRPWVSIQHDGLILVGSSVDGKIYEVDPESATDDGVMIERIVSATVGLNAKPPRNDSVSIGVGCSGDTTIRLRWKDGQDDFPAYYDEIEARAPFDVAQLWRLGQPDQPYRTLEISCVAAEKISLFGMIANDAWA